MIGLVLTLACVASVSARVRREKLGREQKKGMTGEGEGEGKKETLTHKPHDFEKLRSPTNAASDWCGAGSVDYLALETSIRPGMLCFDKCATDLVLSDLWSQAQLLWTDLNRVCAKVYEIEQWRLGKANLLRMTACGSDWKKMDCLLEITST